MTGIGFLAIAIVPAIIGQIVRWSWRQEEKRKLFASYMQDKNEIKLVKAKKEAELAVERWKELGEALGEASPTYIEYAIGQANALLKDIIREQDKLK